MNKEYFVLCSMYGVVYTYTHLLTAAKSNLLRCQLPASVILVLVVHVYSVQTQHTGIQHVYSVYTCWEGWRARKNSNQQNSALPDTACICKACILVL